MGVKVMWVVFVVFLVSISLAKATVTDIFCLETIKKSLKDPNGYLSNWVFTDRSIEGFLCKFTGVECWHPDENRVINLRLSDFGLQGQFPRGIENCTSLTGLDLSGNNLSGPVPSDVARRLQYVTSLDLSSNAFSGEIPPGLANCTYLNVLRLDDNRFTGRIPLQLGQLPRIKTFSVAGNMLSGPVPQFMNPGTVTAESYARNLGLCGAPLRSCDGHGKNVLNK